MMLATKRPPYKYLKGSPADRRDKGKPLDKWIEQQETKRNRERARKRGPGRGQFPSHPVVRLGRQMLALARGFGPKAAATFDLTPLGRHAIPDCGDPGWAGCSNITGVAFCALLQAAPADGTCGFPPVTTVSAGAGVTISEQQKYPVPAPVNWRRGVVRLWPGTRPQGGSYPALSNAPLRIIPATGRGAYVRPGDAGLADGGEGLGWQPLPARSPQLRPGSLPIGQPAPLPLPAPARWLPYRTPDPVAPAEAQPQWGPGTPSRPLPWEPVAPRNPTPGRVVPAGPTFSFSPDAQPKTEPAARHQMTSTNKTESRDKERKVTVQNLVTRVALRIVNMTTESCDVVDAAWKALPKKIQQSAKSKNIQPYIKHIRKGYDPSEYDKKSLAFNCTKKAQAVYDHWDKVDMRKFLSGLAENEVEDQAIGRVGERVKKFSKEWFARKVGIGAQAGGSLGKTPKDAVLPGNKKPWEGMFDSIFGV